MAAQQIFLAPTADNGNNNNNISNNSSVTEGAPAAAGQTSPSSPIQTTSPSTSSAVSPPTQQKSRPRSYSSRSKENLLQAGVLDNPYANASAAATASGGQIPLPQPPSSSLAFPLPPAADATQAAPLSTQSAAPAISTVSTGSASSEANSPARDQNALFADDGSDIISDLATNDAKQKKSSGFGKLLSGTGIGSVKRRTSSNTSPSSDAEASSTKSDAATRVNSAVGIPIGKSGQRARSHTITGTSAELAKLTSPKKNNVDKEKAMAAIAAQENSAHSNVLDSFAYFCMVDNEPRIQRKVLFAINQRHSQFHHNRISSNRVLQDYADRHDLRNGGKRVNSLSGIGGKLNSLLRNKKTKKNEIWNFSLFKSKHP